MPMSMEQLALAPLVITATTVMVALLADAFLPDGQKRPLAWLCAAGLVLAGVAGVAGAVGLGHAGEAFAGMVAVDRFALFFQVALAGVGLLVVALTPAYLERQAAHKGEFYVLLMAALTGMMLLVAATNLVTVFLGIELLSIALYVLSAFLRLEEASQEAGLKYLLIGGFASGLLLYGMALLYGGTGTTSIAHIGALLPHLSGEGLTFSIAGIALVLVGVAYKASAAPFHAWTPDVYQGAPAPVVAFMSVGTKVAVVAALLRVFDAGLMASSARWAPVLGAIAAVSMIVGAVGAVVQSDLKRMLAYSSVAQAGYLLLAVVAGGRDGMVAATFYLAAYTAMTFGGFGLVALLGESGGRAPIQAVRGLGYRHPVMGALLALFMFSLAGFPPTVGFFGKLFVFEATIRAGYTGLAVVGVISSAISIYYYLRVVALAYARDDQPDSARQAADPWGLAAVTVAGVLTIALGVLPGVLYGLAQGASLL
jgi:NADH-quinone oxidoreductase subunit N